MAAQYRGSGDISHPARCWVAAITPVSRRPVPSPVVTVVSRSAATCRAARQRRSRRNRRAAKKCNRRAATKRLQQIGQRRLRLFIERTVRNER
eukprot:5767420-Prymnesium_polylepis.1